MLNKKLDWHFFLTIVAFDWRLKISINFLDRYFRWHLLVWFFATELFRGLLIVDNCQECLRLDPPENACTKNDNVIHLINPLLFKGEFLMHTKITWWLMIACFMCCGVRVRALRCWICFSASRNRRTIKSSMAREIKTGTAAATFPISSSD